MRLWIKTVILLVGIIAAWFSLYPIWLLLDGPDLGFAVIILIVAFLGVSAFGIYLVIEALRKRMAKHNVL